jgi:hypothetical protein
VEILAGLTAIANDWWWLAVTWHALLAVLLLMLVAGWRPTTRSLSHLLIMPLFSVSLLAWVSGNPFNGTTFAVLAGALALGARRVPNAPVQIVPSLWGAPGVALVIFGWTYPHFLRTDSWTPYLYASPFGLLPCPTLSVVIGMTLLVPALRSSLWNTALFVAGLLYGGVGTFQLGVSLDWALLFASATLAGLLLHGRRGDSSAPHVSAPLNQTHAR